MFGRLARLPITALGVGALVFLCLHMVPGDPVDIMLGESAAPGDTAALRHQLGLDLSLPAQWMRFVRNAAQGDLGWSVAYRAPVGTVIAERWTATATLAGAAMILAVAAALPLGIAAGLGADGRIDRMIRFTSLVGTCVPTFVLAPALILVFSMALGWLPVSGRSEASSVVLPAVTLAIGMAGLLVRLTRASVIDTLREPFVRTARAKGAPRWRVVCVHVLRNACLPVVTVVALQTGALLSGAIVTETIFAWPGIGRLIVQAISARDYPLVQGCVLVLGLSYAVVNTVADLVLDQLDPRVRHDDD